VLAEYPLVLALLAIATLLLAIIYFKIHAFVALITVSALTAMLVIVWFSDLF